MAKLFTGRMCRMVADHCIQLHGGFGYMKESVAGRAFVDTIAASLGSAAEAVEARTQALATLFEERIEHLDEVVDRRGLLVPVTGLTPPRDGETVQIRDVRFRTVGDITCTCPVESMAATAADIVLETLAADVSERGATRMDDKTSEASMEKRKKDGYF